MLQRFSLKEIKYERVRNHVVRRLAYAKSVAQWNSNSIGRANLAALEQWKDRHRNETCVIICNGPSINRTDMSLVRNKTSFCMNRSYLMFDTWGFIPTYFSIGNELVLRQFLDDIRALPMPKFTDFVWRDLLKPEDETTYFRMPPRLSDKFEGDLRDPLSAGGTITFVTLQIAYYLGFSKVIIIGMDHRFSAKGAPSTSEVRESSVDRDHLHPDYFPKGMKWEFPDLVRSELAYAQADAAYKRSGRRIIDATVDGACTVFEKMPLDQAFRA